MRFSTDHEWVRPDGDLFVVGITAFAVEQLGDIVFVDLPAEGQTLTPSESFAVVESVKTASDVYAPMAGEVTAANAALSDTPETVNADPEGEGWFVRIRATDPAAFEALLDRDGYEAFLATL